MKFKVFLWRLGVLKESVCPVCGGKLIKHGFKYYNEAFTCVDESCKFNEVD